MRKRNLQIATAIVAATPVTVGAMALFYGARSPLYNLPSNAVSPVLDSNFRFLAGEWFGVGLAAYWLIPRIERQTVLFRAIWCAVFVGGIGRVVSLVTVGPPPPLQAAFLVIEILGAPVFIYWQHRVATAATAARRADDAPAALAPPA